MELRIAFLAMGLLLCEQEMASASCSPDTLVIGLEFAFSDDQQSNPNIGSLADEQDSGRGFEDADQSNPSLGVDDDGFSDEDFFREDDIVEFRDGVEYTGSMLNKVRQMVYIRTFSNTNWQSLYVPFSLSADTLARYGVQLAELNDVHMYDLNNDGKPDQIMLEFFRMTSGMTLPNYPYIISADRKGEMRMMFNDVEMKSADERRFECSSLKQVFAFCGTYRGVSGQTMFDNRYYAMSGGGLARAASVAASLKPQRWYMSIENKDGTSVDYSPTIRMLIDESGEVEMGTSLSKVSNAEAQSVFFTLLGVKVTATDKLIPGIYIKKSKPIVVK